MKIKKIELKEMACSTSLKRPFGCMELWAGNERAHRSLELAGLESDVIAIPSGADRGGDLSAVFSCSDDVARVVLADCMGHGYVASGVARHVHHLLHKFQDIRDTAGLLAALNDEFTLSSQGQGDALRLTTVVTGTFDAQTGEFNFAYAAHPRMLLWRARESKFLELGQGLENFPLGFATGENYNEQSVRLQIGDMILAFSDGATEVESPDGIQLSPSGFLELAEKTVGHLPSPLHLPTFSEALLDGVRKYRGMEGELEDDITLLTLRRSP
jgi:sigma-B regulation protein RsbU (phosphoserine phosphatase)